MDKTTLLERGRDVLRGWRERADLSCEAVDRLLACPAGTTSQRESLGLYRVPLRELSKMMRLYQVSEDEILETMYEPFMKGPNPFRLH